MSWQAPPRVKYADLTVDSVDEFRALDRDDSSELQLADAYHQLEEQWYEVQPASSDEGCGSTNRRAGQAEPGGPPRPEVVSALKALGSFPVQGSRAAGPGLSPPQGGDGGWAMHQEAAMLRMPSDRQVQRPARMQRAEWAHLGAHLAVCGRQLAPDLDTGVQHVPAPTTGRHAGAHAATHPHDTSPTKQHASQQVQAEEGPWWAPEASQQLSVTGRSIRLQSAPAALPAGCSLQGSAGGAAGASQGGGEGVDEEVLCEDGCEEEVLAVQWDAWEEGLLSWGQPKPRRTAPHGPGSSSGSNRGKAPEGVGQTGSTPQQPQQQQQQQGCGWESLVGPGDVRDTPALKQGLPPMRPDLSMCEQLVTLAMERWWHDNSERLALLVNKRLQARAQAQREAWQQQRQQQQQSAAAHSPSPMPQEEASATASSPCQRHSSDQEAIEADTDPHDASRGPSTFQQHMAEMDVDPHPQAPVDPRAGYDWRKWFASPPAHLPLGQGVLTQQGFQAMHTQPAPVPVVTVPKRVAAIQGSGQTAEAQAGPNPPSQPTAAPTLNSTVPMSLPAKPSVLGGAMWPSAGIRAAPPRTQPAFKGLRAVSMPARLPRHTPASLEPMVNRPRAILPPDRAPPGLTLQPPMLRHSPFSGGDTLHASPITAAAAAVRTRAGSLAHEGSDLLMRHSAPNTPTVLQQLQQQQAFSPPPVDLPPINSLQPGGVVRQQHKQQQQQRGSTREEAKGLVVLPPLAGHQPHVAQPSLFQAADSQAAQHHNLGLQSGAGRQAQHLHGSPRQRPGAGGPHQQQQQQQRAGLSLPAGAMTALSEALQLGAPHASGSGSSRAQPPGRRP